MGGGSRLSSGPKRERWERKLDLAYGIPVYDIFGRVCGHMDAQAGEACFRQWVQELQKLTQSHVNATDGKNVRRSLPRSDALAGPPSTWSVTGRQTQLRFSNAFSTVLIRTCSESGMNENVGAILSKQSTLWFFLLYLLKLKMSSGSYPEDHLLGRQ